MSTGRNITVILLSMVLFLFALPAIFLLPAELFLFRSAAYQNSFNSNGLYERIPEYLGENLYFQGGLPGGREIERRAVSYLSEEDYLSITNLVVTPVWAEAQVTSLTDQLFKFLNFQNDHLSLVLDIRDIKSQLLNEHSEVVAEVIVSSWPACGLDDVVIFGLALLSGDLNNQWC